MADYRRSIPILVEMLYSALLLISLIAGIAVSVVKVAPFFQQPQIVYVTQEMPAYPMTDGESKLVPVEIRATLAAGSAGKILCLAVQNRGDKAAADVLVRLNLSADDGYLGGWTSRSDDQSVEHMLGTETEYTLDRLVPADEATFCLYLKNVNSNLADRIEVYDGKGHRAAYYKYVPVRFVGNDQIVMPIRRSWIQFICAMVVILVLPSVSGIKKRK